MQFLYKLWNSISVWATKHPKQVAFAEKVIASVLARLLYDLIRGNLI